MKQMGRRKCISGMRLRGSGTGVKASRSYDTLDYDFLNPRFWLSMLLQHGRTRGSFSLFKLGPLQELLVRAPPYSSFCFIQRFFLFFPHELRGFCSASARGACMATESTEARHALAQRFPDRKAAGQYFRSNEYNTTQSHSAPIVCVNWSCAFSSWAQASLVHAHAFHANQDRSHYCATSAMGRIKDQGAARAHQPPPPRLLRTSTARSLTYQLHSFRHSLFFRQFALHFTSYRAHSTQNAGGSYML